MKRIASVLVALVLLLATAVWAQATPVKIVVRGDPATFPLMAAAKFGFFEKSGIRVELVDIPSTRTAYTQLLKGQVDFVASLTNITVNLALDGEPLRVVRKFASGSPAVSVGRETFLPAEVCAKHVAVLHPASHFYYFVLQDTCQRLGVPVNPANLTLVDAARDLIPLIESGRVEVAVAGTSFGLEAEALSGLKWQPFSNSPVPTRAALVTSQSYLESHRDEVRRLVRALDATVRWLKNSPPEAIKYYGDFFSDEIYKKDIRRGASRIFAFNRDYWSVSGACDPRVDVEILARYLERPLPAPFAPLIPPGKVSSLRYSLKLLFSTCGQIQ